MTASSQFRRFVIRGALVGLSVACLVMAIAATAALLSGSAEYIGVGWFVLLALTLPWSLAAKAVGTHTVAGGWLTMVVIAPMIQAALIASMLWGILAIARRLTRS